MRPWAVSFGEVHVNLGHAAIATRPMQVAWSGCGADEVPPREGWGREEAHVLYRIDDGRRHALPPRQHIAPSKHLQRKQGGVTAHTRHPAAFHVEVVEEGVVVLVLPLVLLDQGVHGGVVRAPRLGLRAHAVRRDVPVDRVGDVVHAVDHTVI